VFDQGVNRSDHRDALAIREERSQRTPRTGCVRRSHAAP
jgi:hypothetical protein